MNGWLLSLAALGAVVGAGAAPVVLAHLWEPVRATTVAWFDVFVAFLTTVASGVHEARLRLRDHLTNTLGEIGEGRAAMWKIIGAFVLAPLFLVLIRAEYDLAATSLESFGLVGELGDLSGFIIVGFTLVSGGLFLDVLGVTHLFPVGPLSSRYPRSLIAVTGAFFVFALAVGFAVGYHRGVDADVAKALPDAALLQTADIADALRVVDDARARAVEQATFAGVVSGSVTVMLLLASTLVSWTVFHVIAALWLAVLAMITSGVAGADLFVRILMGAAERTKILAQAALYAVAEFGRKIWAALCRTPLGERYDLRPLPRPEPPVRLVPEGPGDDPDAAILQVTGADVSGPVPAPAVIDDHSAGSENGDGQDPTCDAAEGPDDLRLVPRVPGPEWRLS